MNLTDFDLTPSEQVASAIGLILLNAVVWTAVFTDSTGLFL